MSQFTVKLCGNPSKISLLLNVLDVVNANNLYPLVCLDGYHFEDVTLTFSLDERNAVTLLEAIASNVRGSLNYTNTTLTLNASQSSSSGSLFGG